VAEFELSDENVEVEEYWAAAFEFITPAAAAEFLRNTLGLQGPADLYGFGINPRE
jgi:hypothetical protein